MRSWKLALRIAVVSASLVVASGITIGTIEVPGIGALGVALARVAVLALGVLGVPASLDGAVISTDRLVAVVAAQCTAVELILVFSVGVLVCPVSVSGRIWGLLLGVPSICALNIVRVISLLLVGIGFPERFDMVHLALWQTAMVLAAFVIWLLWLRWASGEAHNSDARTTASS